MALVFGASSYAKAGVVEEFLYGVQFAGFNVQSGENVTSGGADLFITNPGTGSGRINYGLLDMSINGPVSLQVSTSNRLFSSMDISLTAAVRTDSPVVPVSYTFGSSVFPDSSSLDGTLFVDAGFSLNELGFYDFELEYSSRQSITDADGSTSPGPLNGDFGPINISGNIYADVLTLVTDPLFAAADMENPFAQLSSQSQLKAILDGSPLDATSQAGLGLNPFAKFSSADSLPYFQDFGASSPLAVVPEPMTMFLLAMGIPVVLHQCSRGAGRPSRTV